MRTARTLVVLAVLFWLSSSTTGAQTALGGIQGVVTDGSGRALAGVAVTITNTATRDIREVMTDDAGRFVAPGLPAGPYEVQASLQGFATRRQLGAVVHAGRVVALRLELGTAPAPETITIAGSAPVVDAARVHAGSVVTSVEIENLPLRTRRVSELLTLTAGVAPAAAGVSVNGLTPAFNRTVIDGADLADTAGDLEAPHAAVREITVDTNAYPARDGRAAGGVVTLVTKSGTNQLNGSVFQVIGHSALNARGAVNELFGLPKNTYRNSQFGGALGGALVENRHFAFGAYEGHRTTETNAVFLNVPPGAHTDGNSRAALDRLRPLAASWDRRLNRDLALFRTDHQLGERQRVTLRYHHHNASGIGLDEAGPQTARQAAPDLATSKRAFAATAASTLGERLGNEALLLISNDREESAGAGAHATVRHAGSDVLHVGPDAMFTGQSTVTRLQLADTVTWVNGAHEIRSGIDARFDNVEAAAPGHYGGSYFFNSLAAFGRGAPTGVGDAYVQSFEGSSTGRTVEPDTTDISLFVQDAWRVNREITASYGLRYDMQRFARTDARPADPQLAAAGIDARGPDGTSALGPRLGVAWAPVGRRIVARGAYGLVAGRTPWPMLAAAHAYDGASVRTVTFRSASGGPAPTFPNRFANVPGGLSSKGTIVVFDPDYRSSRVHHASAGVEWEWMPDTSAAASYQMVRGMRLPRAADVNVGAATPVTLAVVDASGRPSGPIGHYRFAVGPFSSFDRVVTYASTAESRHDGLSLELRRRFSQGHAYRLVYTLSRVEDTAPTTAAMVPESRRDRLIAANSADAEGVRAPGLADRRHRFSGSLIYATSRLAERFDGVLRGFVSDWMVSAIYTAETGAPYSAYVSGDLDGDGNRFNDVAPGTARHQFRLPGSATLDARVARSLEIKDTDITLAWEAFNLLNRADPIRVNETLYDASGPQLRENSLFGQLLEAARPRMMQFAVKTSF